MLITYSICTYNIVYAHMYISYANDIDMYANYIVPITP